jgi:hypothetical protein
LDSFESHAHSRVDDFFRPSLDGTTILKDGEEAAPAKIDSVAPLPDDIRDVLLKLEHRNRTSTAPESAKLSEPERRALVFIQYHYCNNQI